MLVSRLAVHHERTLDERNVLHLTLRPIGHPKRQRTARRLDEGLIEQERAIGDDQRLSVPITELSSTSGLSSPDSKVLVWRMNGLMDRQGGRRGIDVCAAFRRASCRPWVDWPLPRL